MDAIQRSTDLAAVLSSPARVRIAQVLMDGRARTATELAQFAEVTPQTTSTHLERLVRSGLVAREKQGRHRYYKIDGFDAARIVESLCGPWKRSVFDAEPATPVELARTCYDHLAGRLGVSIAQSLLDRRMLRARGSEFLVTKIGEEFFESIELDIDAAREKRRAFARRCLDWSERRSHIGGALGAAIAQYSFDAGWFRRLPETRALRVTPCGKRELANKFGVTLPPLRTGPSGVAEGQFGR